MDLTVTIRALSPAQIDEAVPALAGILLDCVAGSASVSFMADLTRERAEVFWRGVAQAARADRRAVLIADRDGGIVGTVQVIPVTMDNQPHRAEVAKMLVHRSARGAGVGAALMMAAEDAARAMGRTLLTLDTVTGAAGDRLYRRMGWTFVGAIPAYALSTTGEPEEASIFYKAL